MQTGISAWVLAIVKALDDAGVESDKLLESIGIAPDKIADLNERFSQDQVTDLWDVAVAETGDDYFGLKVARFVRPSTFHVVGYAMACSENLRRATERFARSARLISDSAVIDFNIAGENAVMRVELNPEGRQPFYHTIDTILAGYFLLSEWILGGSIHPVRVDFQHAPPESDLEYTQIFHCPVYFSQADNSITFRSSDLESPIASANEELAMVLDDMTSKYLSLRFKSRFSSKVREALIVHLSQGEPKKVEIAKELGMTERTLLRRLREENTTFQELLYRLREEMAYDYLRQDAFTIDNISEQLGFSSSSAFSRAFLRWTGERPSEWRSSQRRMRTQKKKG
ncbi:MAG: AraC family transcriptional regulator [Parasphingorhabdus sp.]|uniref:AraC family transcriptional regulator n=1 Tax=Parasphingorhabdus sp. TaxID=2709688 RepID=UPI003002C276